MFVECSLEKAVTNMPIAGVEYSWDQVVANMPIAGIAALLGIVLVFFILGILILCVVLVRLLLEKVPETKFGKKLSSIFGKDKKQVSTKQVMSGDSGLTPQVVAAITAAVAMVLESENQANDQVDFVIKKIIRVK